MKFCEDIQTLLRELHRDNKEVKLKVISGKGHDLIWRATAGSVTLKLPNFRTYTISKETYMRIMPFLYAEESND